MGSGLILLVIVAAWLAVLVPMALRTHESSTSLSSVDRFSDAMRVLSRRDAVARARARSEADDDPLSASAYADNTDDDWDEWDDDVEHAGWRERLGGWRGRGSSLLPGGSAGRRPSSPAVRRRRILLALVALTAGCFAGVTLGGRHELLYAGGALLAVVALFVLQLRRLAVQRAERTRRSAPARPEPGRRAAPAPAAPAVPASRSGSVRVQPASVPSPSPEPVPVRVADDQLFDASLFWEDVAPVSEEAPVATVRHDDPVPARRTYATPAAALGGAWSPVPIPPPTYVTAPRAPRIVDLTRPGAWSQAEARAAADRAAEQLPGSAPKAAPAGDRRRAVNDW